MKNKITTIHKLLATTLLSLVLFSSCGDESNFAPYAESVPTTNASVKFEHVAVGPAGVNFNVNWFLNDVKTSAVLLTTGGLPLGIAFNGQYPAAINYATVAAGSPTMKIEIPATSALAASTVYTGPLTLEANKNYTSFLVGTSPNYTVFNVADDLTVTDASKAYIRFFNFISNSPTTGYDVSISQLNSNAVIYSGVSYLGGNKTFIPITPVADLESATYEVQLRTAGTTTVVAKFTITPRKGRIYTFYSYGYVGGLPATKNLPLITYYTNK